MKNINRMAAALLASVSVIWPVIFVSPTSVAVAQEVSSGDLSSANCATISVGELSALVRATASTLSSQGLSEAALAREIGRQMGEASAGCSLAQARALVRNVVIVLYDLSFALDNDLLLAIISEGFAETASPIVVAEALDEFIPADDRVY